MKKINWPTLEVHQICGSDGCPLKGPVSATLEMVPDGKQIRPTVHFKHGGRRTTLDFEVAYDIKDNCSKRGEKCGGQCCEATVAAQMMVRIGFLKLWVEDDQGEDDILFQLHMGRGIFELHRPRCDI